MRTSLGAVWAYAFVSLLLVSQSALAGTFPWGHDPTLIQRGVVVSAEAGTVTVATDEFADDLPSWMSLPRFTFYQGRLIRVVVDVSDPSAAWRACDAMYGKPFWFDAAGPTVRWVIPGEAIELRPTPTGHELVWAATVIPIPDTL